MSEQKEPEVPLELQVKMINAANAILDAIIECAGRIKLPEGSFKLPDAIKNMIVREVKAHLTTAILMNPKEALKVILKLKKALEGIEVKE